MRMMSLNKVAAYKNRVAQYAITDPFVSLFVLKYENLIPWNSIVPAKAYEKGRDRAQYQIEKVAAAMFDALEERIRSGEEDGVYLSPEEVRVDLGHDGGDPQVQQLRSMYRRDPDTLRKKLSEHINGGRREALSKWFSFWRASGRPKSFAYVFMRPMVAELGDARGSVGVWPLMKFAVNEVMRSVAASAGRDIGVFAEYRKSMKFADDGWIAFDGGSPAAAAEGFDDDVARLMVLGLDAGWCIKDEAMARKYLGDGDFHVLMEGGRAVVGIRTEGSRIKEIAGRNNKSSEAIRRWEKVVPYAEGLPYEKGEEYANFSVAVEISRNPGYAVERFKEVKGNPYTGCEKIINTWYSISPEGRTPEVSAAYAQSLREALARKDKSASSVMYDLMYHGVGSMWLGLAEADEISPGLMDTYVVRWSMNTDGEIAKPYVWDIVPEEAKRKGNVAGLFLGLCREAIGGGRDANRELLAAIFEDGDERGKILLPERGWSMEAVNAIATAGAMGGDEAYSDVMGFCGRCRIDPDFEGDSVAVAENNMVANALADNASYREYLLKLIDAYDEIEGRMKERGDVMLTTREFYVGIPDKLIEDGEFLKKFGYFVNLDFFEDGFSDRRIVKAIFDDRYWTLNIVAQIREMPWPAGFSMETLWEDAPEEGRRMLLDAVSNKRHGVFSSSAIDGVPGMLEAVVGSDSFNSDTMDLGGEALANPWEFLDMVPDDRKAVYAHKIFSDIDGIPTSKLYSMPDGFVAMCLDAGRNLYGQRRETILGKISGRMIVDPPEGLDDVRIPDELLGTTGSKYNVLKALNRADFPLVPNVVREIKDSWYARNGADKEYLDGLLAPDRAAKTLEAMGYDPSLVQHAVRRILENGDDAGAYPEQVVAVMEGGAVTRIMLKGMHAAIAGRDVGAFGTIANVVRAATDEQILDRIREDWPHSNLRDVIIKYVSHLKGIVNRSRAGDDRIPDAEYMAGRFMGMLGEYGDDLETKFITAIEGGAYRESIDMLASMVDDGSLEFHRAVEMVGNSEYLLRPWVVRMSTMPPEITREWYLPPGTARAILEMAMGVKRWWSDRLSEEELERELDGEDAVEEPAGDPVPSSVASRSGWFERGMAGESSYGFPSLPGKRGFTADGGQLL